MDAYFLIKIQTEEELTRGLNSGFLNPGSFLLLNSDLSNRKDDLNRIYGIRLIPVCKQGVFIVDKELFYFSSYRSKENLVDE